MAAVGLTNAGQPVDVDDGPAYLWPECEDAWGHFLDLGDQWRDGVLPRSEMLAHLREVCPDEAERRDAYEGVIACARAVRKVYSDHADERRKRERAQRRR